MRKNNKRNSKNKIKSVGAKAAKSLDQKREELMGVLLVLLGLLIAISLFTYNHTEIPQTAKAGQVTNGLGIVGVYIAYYLIRLTIGYAVLVIPFLIIAWGINRFFGKPTERLLHWTIFTLLFSFYVSVSGALRDVMEVAGKTTEHLFSGYFGGLLAEIIYKIFGQYGSVLVLVGLILITVLLSTEITFRELFLTISAYMERFFIWFLRYYQSVLNRLMSKKKSQRNLKIQRNFRPAQIKKGPPVPTTPTSQLREFKEDVFITESGMPDIPSSQIDEDIPEDDDPQKDQNVESVPIIKEYTYDRPSLDFLQEPQGPSESLTDELLRDNARLLEEKLADFGIKASVIEINPGPVITRYELEPAPGIKVSRITSLADDLAMAMRAKRIRIVAPIPGKAAVGIELPNPNPEIVYLKEIINDEKFQNSESPLTIALGKTSSGKTYVTDLSQMPHLLIAGSTGSGKSVCLNTVITSILYKSLPTEVQFVMIDPKRLELSVYAQLHRHHLTYVAGSKEKVSTTIKSAVTVLKSVEQEMERRYKLLAGIGVRNIKEYNQRINNGQIPLDFDNNPQKQLEYLVVIIDELADLMMSSSASKEVEEPIARLTQMSRAVGIHLIVATQRPSVDVITGVIKANFPARIAFQVASKVDSRTILDMNGAEKLLGRGDMLFLPPASPEPTRIHNAYLGLEEIENVIKHIRSQPPVEKQPLQAYVEEETVSRNGYGTGSRDALFNEALKIVVRNQQGSVSLLQRRLKVGYSRAARIIDELEDAGIVGPFEGSKAREVLMTPEDLEDMATDNDDEFE